MFTVIVMGLLIIWALRNMAKELGLFDIAKKKLEKKFDDD